jgi:ribonuclease-3
MAALDERQLEDDLHYKFRDRNLLKTALTHPSYKAETANLSVDNQRLEFLGDAVLQLVISELLYEKHESANEGFLSKVRAALTNETALAELAEELKLGTYLKLGKGEEQSGGRSRPSNLADAFEAVLGALHLDGSFEVSRQFIRRLCEKKVSEAEILLRASNPKGRLQELTQELFQSTPFYEVQKVSGPMHLPEFEVAVLLEDRPLARATAGNRKTAEKKAALRALESLQSQSKDQHND